MNRKAIAVLMVFALSFSLGSLGFITNGFAQSVEVKNYGGVSYISGGIGMGEREELEAMGQNYDLKLVFAIQQGNYLSDVKVMIKGSSGNSVLEAASDGPWFYAQLPAGTYHVSATTMGKTITKVARVTAGRRTQLNFVWTGK
ncbi:MAG: hypothetical protein WCA08_01580 [Desulfoferrobacter sp.]